MMSDPIKLLVKGILQDTQLSNWELGKVVSVEPIRIKISDIAEPLDEEFIVLPERLTREEYTLKINGGQNVVISDYGAKHSVTHPTHGSEILDHSGSYPATLQYNQQVQVQFMDVKLEIGDSVILLKATGGQKYFVLDRV